MVKTERAKAMFYSREKTIEKLSAWLTPETCAALADFAEDKYPGKYFTLIDYLSDYVDDADGLRDYIEYILGTDAAAGDKIDQMAAEMRFET